MLCQCFHYWSTFFFLFFFFRFNELFWGCVKRFAPHKKVLCAVKRNVKLLNPVTQRICTACTGKDQPSLLDSDAEHPKFGDCSPHTQFFPIVRSVHSGSCLALKRWQFFQSGTLLRLSSADTNSSAVFETCLVSQFVWQCPVGTLRSRVRCCTRCQPLCKALLLLSELYVSAHTKV